MIETIIDITLEIPVDNKKLTGDLVLPKNCNGIILFSHGSGSSRLSPRNRYVASSLQENGIGTFMFDLLTPEEDNFSARFDIDLLTSRLTAVTEWIIKQEYCTGLGVGIFGASTGAASALNSAAILGDKVKAVVSRGGRPDLALPTLPDVKAATLLMVGSLDYYVIQLNEQAYGMLKSPKQLIIISDAGHLFEEEGKLEEVADHAGRWFLKYLTKTGK